MDQGAAGLRSFGVGAATFGLLPWVLLSFAPGQPGEREAAAVVADLLRETRTRAIMTGRPHRLNLSSPGGPATFEIHERGTSTPGQTTTLTGITLERGPSWIEVDPMGGLRTPLDFGRATLAQSWNDGGSSPPIRWADIVLASSNLRRACLVLDNASGSVYQSYLLFED